jgi:hypothetical protein
MKPQVTPAASRKALNMRRVRLTENAVLNAIAMALILIGCDLGRCMVMTLNQKQRGGSIDDAF